MNKLKALLVGVVLSVAPLVFTAGPASAATCNGGWFNAQYPVFGSGAVSAVASCQGGYVGYPYASMPSPSTRICLQYFNPYDRWVTKACTNFYNNAGPTYVQSGLILGSWRTMLQSLYYSNQYSAVRPQSYWV